MNDTTVGATVNLRHGSRVILLNDRDEVGLFLTLERGQEQEQAACDARNDGSELLTHG